MNTGHFTPCRWLYWNICKGKTCVPANLRIKANSFKGNSLSKGETRRCGSPEFTQHQKQTQAKGRLPEHAINHKYTENCTSVQFKWLQSSHSYFSKCYEKHDAFQVQVYKITQPLCIRHSLHSRKRCVLEYFLKGHGLDLSAYLQPNDQGTL